VEIKDAVVDETAWKRVEATHGRHDYALFVLATGFRPAEMQWRINGFAQTFAVHLFDYLATLIFAVATDEDKPTGPILDDILAICNTEFWRRSKRTPASRSTFRLKKAKAGRQMNDSFLLPESGALIMTAIWRGGLSGGGTRPMTQTSPAAPKRTRPRPPPRPTNPLRHSPIGHGRGTTTAPAAFRRLAEFLRRGNPGRPLSRLYLVLRPVRNGARS
jgi:hypothetical protein